MDYLIEIIEQGDIDETKLTIKDFEVDDIYLILNKAFEYGREFMLLFILKNRDVLKIDLNNKVDGGLSYIDKYLIKFIYDDVRVTDFLKTINLCVKTNGHLISNNTLETLTNPNRHDSLMPFIYQDICLEREGLKCLLSLSFLNHNYHLYYSLLKSKVKFKTKDVNFIRFVLSRNDHESEFVDAVFIRKQLDHELPKKLVLKCLEKSILINNAMLFKKILFYSNFELDELDELLEIMKSIYTSIFNYSYFFYIIISSRYWFLLIKTLDDLKQYDINDEMLTVFDTNYKIFRFREKLRNKVNLLSLSKNEICENLSISQLLYEGYLAINNKNFIIDENIESIKRFWKISKKLPIEVRNMLFNIYQTHNPSKYVIKTKDLETSIRKMLLYYERIKK